LRVRAFFGLPVPEPQRSALAAYLEACAAAAPEFRWTQESNLHLTIRFIGSVDGELVLQIAARLAAVAPAGFDLELGDIGTFKRSRLARVVWLGLRSGSAAAVQLAARVEAECQASGLEGESRPFQPHLTLARARERDGSPLPALPAPPSLARWRARELVLYSSRLTRTGAVHEPMVTIYMPDEEAG
jgi:2'-5' RNA ligase